jgi:hypothetical protein
LGVGRAPPRRSLPRIAGARWLSTTATRQL